MNKTAAMGTIKRCLLAEADGVRTGELTRCYIPGLFFQIFVLEIGSFVSWTGVNGAKWRCSCAVKLHCWKFFELTKLASIVFEN